MLNYVASGAASNVSRPSLKWHELIFTLARQTARVHTENVDRTSARGHKYGGRSGYSNSIHIATQRGV